MKRPSGLHDDIRAQIAQGLRNKEIAAKLGCNPSRVSQVRHAIKQAPAPRMSDGFGVARFRKAPEPDTCQRPDARKGFAVCGEPKKRTACGERLGVCAYHWESTKPVGNSKW